MNEVEPPWLEDGLKELFGVVFSIQITLSIAYSGIVAGREPTADDMEPMSWAIYSMVRKLNAVEGAGALQRLQTSPGGWSRSWSPTTRCSRPRWPSARCRWAR